MVSKIKKVDKRFSNFNCAQTVFSLFAAELGIDEKTALKISSGFGGGMTCAETCGAVTGSYMVIGMKHGHSTSNPDEKANSKLQIQKFNKMFIEEHGSLICKNLLGCDISTTEGLASADEKNLFKTKCTGFIKSACNILEKDF